MAQDKDLRKEIIASYDNIIDVLHYKIDTIIDRYNLAIDSMIAVIGQLDDDNTNARELLNNRVSNLMMERDKKVLARRLAIKEIKEHTSKSINIIEQAIGRNDRS